MTLKKILGEKVADIRKIQTLLTVDFYNHDTQSSNIIEGLRPFFNFQLCYRVVVDDFFLRYLETDSFRVNLNCFQSWKLIISERIGRALCFDWL